MLTIVRGRFWSRVITPTQTMGHVLSGKRIYGSQRVTAKFERLLEEESDPAHEAATELEALVLLLPSEKSRQLAQVQVKEG
jgi:hypothetical protein